MSPAKKKEASAFKEFVNLGFAGLAVGIIVFAFKMALVMGNYMETRLSMRDEIRACEEQVANIALLLEQPEDNLICTSLLRECYRREEL